jgi:hypothetical protein
MAQADDDDLARCPGAEAYYDLLRRNAFHAGGWRGLAPGQPVECLSEGAAIRRAEAMSHHEANAGAVAFSRRGDPNLGDFEDPVVLKTFGQVPDDFS